MGEVGIVFDGDVSPCLNGSFERSVVKGDVIQPDIGRTMMTCCRNCCEGNERDQTAVETDGRFTGGAFSFRGGVVSL